MHQTVVDLLRGNAAHAEAFDARFDDVQEAQHPNAVTVCCADSRVLQDQMWDNDEPGELFTCSNIGNRVRQSTESGPVVTGDVLFPLQYFDTDVAVVVGHTGCGAVTAAYDDLTEGVDVSPGVRHCLDSLTPHLASALDRLPEGLDRAATVNHLVEYNVDRQIETLRQSDEVPDGVELVGCVYDFQDAYPGRRGEVYVVNVDGERRVDELRRRHLATDGRIYRFWEY
ncbi:carbonic anhydrase [Haloplanus vescus]|uniref:carbonic anhydrase n=1 Tax=Haloplanus vescus TaxID=555874 RepID=A0A1H3WIC2_9EURY|nr:carbonic anhydrase [Haloplanus vescus]SDZ86869.1 carbonic anhydrase [Haloplanus vescus]